MELIEEIKNILKDDKSVVISNTGDDEYLFYRKINEDYINLIVDDDLDIEILVIKKDRTETYNEIFSHGEYKLEDVIERFNKLCAG